MKKELILSHNPDLNVKIFLHLINLKLLNIYKIYNFFFIKEEKTKIYPNNTIDDQDFCYLIIDPFKRHIIVLYHKFDGAIALD